MSRSPLRAALAAGALSLALALPASARAATFCVYSPSGCTGTAKPNVQAALDAADLAAGRDEIQVGEHTNTAEAIDVVPGNAVDILAPGSTRNSILVTAVTVREPSTVLKNLSFWGASTSDQVLDLGAATGDGIAAGGDIPYTGTAVHVAGGTLKNATINGGQAGTGLLIDGAGATIEKSIFQGWNDIVSSGADVTIDHTIMHGDNVPLRVTGGSIDLDTVTVTRMGPFVGTATSFGALEVLPASPVTLTARSVTISGSTRTPSQGLLAKCTTSTADITLTDSLAAMNGTDLVRSGVGCDVHLDHVGYETRDAGGGAFDDVAGVVTGPMVPASQRYWGGIPKPMFGFPATDAGTATSVTPGATDIAGNPRLVGSKTDLGAYEYQDTPPNGGLSWANLPPTAVAGTAVSLTATGPDGDADGEPLTYVWAIDGATVGTGKSFTWMPLLAGTVTMAVSVVDPAGNSSPVVSRVITVKLKGDPPPPPPTDTTPATTTKPGGDDKPAVTTPATLPLPTAPKAANVTATLASKKLSGGVLKVKVACAAGGQDCKGKVVLKAGNVALGSATFSAKAGAVVTVKVKVSAKVAKRALAKKGTKVALSVLRSDGKAWKAGKGGTVKR